MRRDPSTVIGTLVVLLAVIWFGGHAAVALL